MRAVSEAANAVEAPKVEAAGGSDLGNLTEEERAARIRALRGAAHDEERRQIAEIENQKRLEEEEKTRKEAEEAEQKAAEEEEARNKAEAELQAAAEAAAAAAPASEEAAGNRPKRAETTRSEPRRSAASSSPRARPRVDRARWSSVQHRVRVTNRGVATANSRLRKHWMRPMGSKRIASEVWLRSAGRENASANARRNSAIAGR